MRTGLTVTHWGAYEVDADDGAITAVRPFAKDPDPSPIGASLRAVTKSRVRAPSIRKSWLEGGPGSRTDLRGAEPFVEVDWDTALDLAATELDRIRTEHTNQAIFGGSYGWASAGRSPVEDSGSGTEPSPASAMVSPGARSRLLAVTRTRSTISSQCPASPTCC